VFEPAAPETAVTPPVDADAAVRHLREAAELIWGDPLRQGRVLTFGAAGQLVMTGDLHGHLRNFEKLQRFADLAHSPGRFVMLHELIHCEPEPPDHLDLSIDLVVRAAAWKCAFPDNVFFLQANHELSQLCRHEITKGGRSVLDDFARGVAHRYGSRAPDVLAALDEYIAALPLAARTANGLFLAHSLPDPLSMAVFDPTIFQRELVPADLEPGGSVYALVWGRYHSPDVVAYFARQLGVQAFIVGHTPQEMGYAIVGPMIILASDHAHGTFLPIDLSRAYTLAELEQAIRKFVSVE
jgi:hypothetical protein